MPLDLIIDVTNPERRGLLADFNTMTVGAIPDFVRNDKSLPIIVRPVIPSDGDEPWEDDHASGDTYRVSIGNPDEAADGGTFVLAIDGETASALAHDITAAALQTALSAASVAGGNPAVVVTELTEGVFQIDGATVGVLPLISGDATDLLPVCGILVNQIATGSVSTKGRQILQIYRQPVVNDFPATAEPGGAGVSGVLNINTENLLKDFSRTDERVLGYYMQVFRSRVDEEEKTILNVPVRLHRNIIDVGSLNQINAAERTAVFYVEMEYSGDAQADQPIGGWSPIGACNIVGVELWARQIDETTDTEVDLYVDDARQYKRATLAAGEQFQQTIFDDTLNVSAGQIVIPKFLTVGDPPAGEMQIRLICRAGTVSTAIANGVMLDRDGSFILDRDGFNIAFR